MATTRAVHVVRVPAAARLRTRGGQYRVVARHADAEGGCSDRADALVYGASAAG